MMETHKHEINKENEKRTLIVIIFTVITMIAEIFYGYITNSMALLADGYHMGTHALALGLTYMAYILIRKFNDSESFPNGTDKIGVLAGYTSSLFLGITGIWIIIEAIQRLVIPISIEFNEAIIVAVIGLTVNAVCIFVMEGSHSHHEEADNNEKEDYNYKAAYYHILSDLLTSIFAIAALVIGKYAGIISLDPLVGILGGLLIIKWALSIMTKTVKILVDMK